MMNERKIYEVINEVNRNIEQLELNLSTSEEFRSEQLQHMIGKKEWDTSIIFYNKSIYELDKVKLDGLKDLLEYGIAREGYMKTDFELERLCSFKDINNYTLPLYSEINKIRKEIEWAYINVLQMLGYDTVKTSKMSFRKIRALTLLAIMNEFFPLLIKLSELPSSCKDGLRFALDSSNEIYVSDIALVIELMIKYWNSINSREGSTNIN